MQISSIVPCLMSTPKAFGEHTGKKGTYFGGQGCLAQAGGASRTRCSRGNATASGGMMKLCSKAMWGH